jgi:hypothetical protein
MTEQLTRSGTRVAGFDDGELDFQLLRQLATAINNGASIGETFAAAELIRDRGLDSWPDVFVEFAERQRADGEARAARGHDISAREQFFRACNSYRTAEYFTPNGIPRHAELGQLSRDAFIAAMKLSPWTCEPVSIEVDGMTLPGYHVAPPQSAGTGRLLVATSGFDGTTEETYLQVGPAALERGWQLLLVAGPGQMDTSRRYPDVRPGGRRQRECRTARHQRRWLLRPPYRQPRRSRLRGRCELADHRLVRVHRWVRR